MRKFNLLKAKLKKMESVLIAFSGGVDSTFLLKSSCDILGDKVLAVTAKSSTYPSVELKGAKLLAKKIGVRHLVIDSEELDIPGFKDNPPQRCYHCKKELFGKLIEIAFKKKIKHVLDGSNFDDQGDYRPGMTAAKELGVKSPLLELKFTKKEIRKLSFDLGLTTWNKPSMACLASRFPFGETITADKLIQVNKAENMLKKVGFQQVRVRKHGEIARIEVLKEELKNILDPLVIPKITHEFKKIGFKYISLDLEGYRTGSMNILGN